MGYIATPTPKMGPFVVEVCSAYFRLFGPKDRVHSLDDGAVEFAVADIPALRAALEQVERMDRLGRTFEWARRDESGNWAPVSVVRRANIELGPDVIPPALWLTLMAATGPLRDHHLARQAVIRLAQVASSIPRDDLAEILDALDQTGAEVEELNELRQMLVAALERNEEEYRARAAAVLD